MTILFFIVHRLVETDMLHEKIRYEENLPAKIQGLHIEDWLTRFNDDLEVVYVM